MKLFRKHEPVPEKEMNCVSQRETICAVLRDIYFATENQEVKLKARIATSMAKSMSRKLTEYKEGWENDFFDVADTPNFIDRLTSVFPNIKGMSKYG